MSRRIISVAAVAGLATLALLQLAAPARADEIKLKDGSKINGTIVGFEDNSFKVKTSYGFAVVQKDQVVSITVTDPAKQPEPESAKKPDSDATKKSVPDNAKKSETANAKKSDADAARKTDSVPAKTPVATAAPSPVKTEKVEHASAPAPAKNSDADSAANAIEEYPHTDSPTTSVTNSAAPASAAPNTSAMSNTSGVSSVSNAPTSTAAATPSTAPAPKPAPPEPMREEVSGNLYTNDTYGFKMYKPPTWKLIEGARTILPGSITALGTDDQNTYLLDWASSDWQIARERHRLDRAATARRDGEFPAAGREASDDFGNLGDGAAVPRQRGFARLVRSCGLHSPRREGLHDFRDDACGYRPGADSRERNFPRNHQPAIHKITADSFFASGNLYLISRKTAPAPRNRFSTALPSTTNLLFKLQNFVTSLKWKLLIFIAGTTISNDSSPAARTDGPSISTLASASMTL